MATNFGTKLAITRLAVDMDIHGYIHVWILDFSHPVDISMDIMLLRSYLICFVSYNTSLSVALSLHFLVYLCCCVK